MVVHKKSFYFVRHGESEYNANPHANVGEDSDLTQRGRGQAAAIQPIISKLPIQTVCVSPLQRALQTQEIITSGLNCPVVVIEELRECTHAIWLEMNRLEKEKGRCQVNQETREFMDRTVRAINRALEMPGPVLVVAHGGIHYALCHWLKTDEYHKEIDHCVPVYFNPTPLHFWEVKQVF